MNYLVDTNLLSESRKPHPDPKAYAWLEAHDSELYTSAIVIAEISFGIERKQSGQARQKLEAWLDDILDRFGDGLVLRFDTRVALHWGKLMAATASQPMGMRDSMIAATAIRHDLLVATRNVADFTRPGVQVVNPWL